MYSQKSLFSSKKLVCPPPSRARSIPSPRAIFGDTSIFEAVFWKKKANACIHGWLVIIGGREGGERGGLPPLRSNSYLVTYELFWGLMYCTPPPEAQILTFVCPPMLVIVTFSGPIEVRVNEQHFAYPLTVPWLEAQLVPRRAVHHRLGGRALILLVALQTLGRPQSLKLHNMGFPQNLTG